ncbi:MAG: hypothetical protein EOP48_01535 [Sphingobacteriales bacterium]|nr:MAG: hypothetical protein EOP48_01535 [Sphingobacteriales bacterium]
MDHSEEQASMITIAELNGADVKKYAEFYRKASDFPIALQTDYLEQCELVRIFLNDGEIIGGYVLNSKAPLRFSQCVDDASKYMEVFEDAIELVALAVTYKSKPFRLFFYYTMTYDVLRILLEAKKKWILGCTTVEKLRKFNSHALPHDLFVGNIRGQTYYVFYGDFGSWMRGAVSGVPDALKIPQAMRKIGIKLLRKNSKAA